MRTTLFLILWLLAVSATIMAQPVTYLARIEDSSYTPSASVPSNHSFCYPTNLPGLQTATGPAYLYGGMRMPESKFAWGRINGAGVSAWANTYRFGNLSIIRSVTTEATTDSAFVACAEIDYTANNSFCAFHKLKASDGSVLFAGKIRGTYDQGRPVIGAGINGDVLIGGGNGPNLYRISEAGSLLWAFKYGIGTSNFSIWQILGRPDGGFKVLAEEFPDHALIIDVDSNGNILPTSATLNTNTGNPKKILAPHLLHTYTETGHRYYLASSLGDGSGKEGKTYFVAALDSMNQVIWSKEVSLLDTSASWGDEVHLYPGVKDDQARPAGVIIARSYMPAPSTGLQSMLSFTALDAMGDLLFSKTLGAPSGAPSWSGQWQYAGIYDSLTESLLFPVANDQGSGLMRIHTDASGYCSSSLLPVHVSNLPVTRGSPAYTRTQLAGAFLEALPATITPITQSLAYRCMNGSPVSTAVSGVTTQDRQVRVFPNPVHETLQVYIPEAGTYQFILYDVTGRRVVEQSVTVNPGTVNNPSVTIPLRLNPGMYYYLLEGAKGAANRGKVQVN